MPLPASRINNFFIRLKSWADTDGIGIPDWWQLEYLGYVGIDPNALDSAGDGWTIYQKFLLGVNPNTWITPPAPKGLTVSYNGNTGAVRLNWLPAPGPVTNYLVQKTDGFGEANLPHIAPPSSTALDNVSDETPYEQSYSGPTIYVEYTVTAQYAGGNSAPATVDLESAYLAASLVPAPQGGAYVDLATLPAGTASLNLTRVDLGAEYFGYDLSDYTNYSIPLSSGTNELYPIPASAMVVAADSLGLAYYGWFVQALNASNGATSQALYLSGGYTDQNTISRLVPPYIDGRAALKDDVRFQLRGASGGCSLAVLQGDILELPPTNYVWAGLYFCDVLRYSDVNYEFNDYLTFDPLNGLEQNCLYRNLTFTPGDIDSDGNPDTGAYYNGYYLYWATGFLDAQLAVSNTPAYSFNLAAEISTGNNTTFSSLIAANDGIGILLPDGEASVSSSNTVATYTNIYGLPLVANEFVYSNSAGVQWGNYDVGQALPFTNCTASYLEFQQPDFQTESYYFAFPGINPTPEQNVLAQINFAGITNFAVTNQSPLLMASVGNPVQIAGYAKMAILNGYTNRFAYLGQYFDKAYQIDTNGNVTTNLTGILSEYGNFLATQPGPVALVTMPDIDTGEQGTGVIHCISLNVDKNHDGTMDLSFGGPDATSEYSPMEAWVNNGHDRPGVNGGLDTDTAVPPAAPNSSQGVINCPRDLENFFRLWICGLPQLPAEHGTTVTLSMTPSTGNPSVNLYWSFEGDGGIGYLTNTTIAAEQISAGEVFPTGISVGSVSNTAPYTFPDGAFALGGNYHLLFEGAGIGSGQLTLTVSMSNNVIAQTSAYLDLHDIQDFYERAVITNNTSGTISNWTSAVENVQPAMAYLGADTNLIVFVHGFNVGNWPWLDDSCAVLKRLYWAGYQGKFAAVKWPCVVIGAGTIITQNTTIFNNSEISAYKAAPALKSYLSQLTGRFPGFQLDVLAHSQGNAIMGEAIEEGAPFDNYILTQAAMPASCYDAGASTDPILTEAESLVVTPIVHPMGYQGVYTNITGTIINFFNPQDLVLNLWNGNQAAGKPDGYANEMIIEDAPFYSSNGTNSIYHGVTNAYFVTDPQESRAMVSRSLTQAVGRQDTGGVIDSTIDLNAQFGFVNTVSEHSAQWTRPIQTSFPYYKQVLLEIQPSP